MSNTETISREELETILTQCRTYHADCIAPVSVRKVTTMARMLLEGMSNEPVAYVREDDLYDASIISTPAYRILEDLKEAAVPCEKLIGLYVSSPSPVSLLDLCLCLIALKFFPRSKMRWHGLTPFRQICHYQQCRDLTVTR